MKANVRVLQQLERSTEKLERFNQYLNDIQGYTSTIQRFNEQFQQEETQLGLLRKIYDFFNQELHEIDQRKLAISDAVSCVDEKLQNSFRSLEDSQAEQIRLFREQLQQQASIFNNMLDEQREAFKASSRLIAEKLESELSQYPDTVAQLRTIAQIPSELRTLSDNIMKVMNKVSSDVSRVTSSGVKSGVASTIIQESPKFEISKRLKWLMIAFMSVITFCSVLAAVFCGISAFKSTPQPTTPMIEEEVVPIDTLATVDSTQINVGLQSIPNESSGDSSRK